MLKIGLIGCGGIGAVHAECWLSMGDAVELTAVADINLEKAQKYAKMSGARTYTDGQELLEKEKIDIVDICVPTFLHAKYLVKAMECVKNIIIEKPVCLREEEAQKLMEVQKKTGALVQVAHVVRFTDAYRYLKETVKSGIYGNVVSGSFSRLSPKPLWMKGHDDIDVTGTMILDMHIHDVDFIRYLMECEPEDIKTWSVKDESGIVQHIWTRYSFGKVVVTSEGSWDYPSGLPFASTFRVRLERAAIVLDESGTLAVYPEAGGKIIPDLGEKQEKDLGINVSDLKPYMNEMRYFLEVIQTDNRKGITNLSEAIASFRLARREMELA